MVCALQTFLALVLLIAVAVSQKVDSNLRRDAIAADRTVAIKPADISLAINERSSSAGALYQDNNDIADDDFSDLFDNINDNDYVSSSSSQNVQQQSSSGSYGASSGSGSAKDALASNNVASVIRVQEARDESLDDLYNNNNAQTLVKLNFGRDYYTWNPRLNGVNGSWIWDSFTSSDNEQIPTDNAFIQLVDANGKVQNGAYASAQNSVYKNSNSYGSYATLSTLPFGSESYEEGFVRSAKPFAINSTQRLVVEALFSCRTVDVDKNPYPKRYVTHSEDDERLANCAVSVTQTNSAVSSSLSVAVTNRGVWAVYRSSSFVAKRRIGARARYDSLVDAAIEIDGRTNVATFYLNGYKVWTVYQIGTLPPADGYTNTDLGAPGRAIVTSFDSVYVSFGTEKCLDESNPWNPNDTTRLVRIRGANDPSASDYYCNSTFYDDTGDRGNITWGQGAVMTLYKLKVLRTASNAPAGSVVVSTLPGVYGDAATAAPVYQQQQSSSQNLYKENDKNIFDDNVW